MTFGIDSRKIIFFLFVNYLCIDPLLYMVRHYFFFNGRIFLKNFFLQNSYLNAIRLENIVIVLTIFLILTRKINVDKYLNFYSASALVLFVWIFLIVIVSFFEVGLVNFGQYYGFSTLLIGRGFIFILLGLNVHVINDMFQRKKIRLIFYTIVFIYFIAILLSAIFNPLAQNYSWYLTGIAKTTPNTDPNFIFDYHYISDSCALLLLFVISKKKNIYMKLLITLFGVFLLALSLSRSALICFITASLITFIIHFFKAKIKKILGITVLLVLLIIFASITIPFLIRDAEFSDKNIITRYTPSVFLDTDSSYSYRKELFNIGLLELKNNWLLGRYMAETLENREGSYIHNWLSFLNAFGIGPFLLSVFLIVLASLKILKQFLKNSNSSINELLFLWSIFMIMSIVFARAYSYYYIWFILLGIPMINQGFTKKYSHNISRKP